MRVLLLLVLFVPALSVADVFKCVNDGRVAYSERPCASGAVPYEALGFSSRSLTLVRGGADTFNIAGTVNGMPVNFIVDTGATITAISGDYAYRLGLRSCVPSGFANTANGRVNVCSVFLDVTVAGHVFNRVEVSVMHNSRGVALLGNDLLRHFVLEQRGDTLLMTR